MTTRRIHEPSVELLEETHSHVGAAILVQTSADIVAVAALQHDVEPVDAVIVTDCNGHTKVIAATHTSATERARRDTAAFMEKTRTAAGLVPEQRRGGDES